MRCLKTRSPLVERAVCVCDVWRLCSHLEIMREPAYWCGWMERQRKPLGGMIWLQNQPTMELPTSGLIMRGNNPLLFQPLLSRRSVSCSWKQTAEVRALSHVFFTRGLKLFSSKQRFPKVPQFKWGGRRPVSFSSCNGCWPGCRSWNRRHWITGSLFPFEIKLEKEAEDIPG